MKWIYQIQGGHTHVRVYINGALAGQLTFRNDEFNQIMKENADGSLFLTFERSP